MQPHQIVGSRSEAGNGVGEGSNAIGGGRRDARRLVHGCRRRVGHLARVDGVGVTDRRAAAEVYVRDEGTDCSG